MALAPACTMALICWICRWALGPATCTCRSTLSRSVLLAAMALTMLAASACQSLPMKLIDRIDLGLVCSGCCLDVRDRSGCKRRGDRQPKRQFLMRIVNLPNS